MDPEQIKRMMDGFANIAPTGNNVVPFGKYRGQPMEVLHSDPDYVQWALDNGVISDTRYRQVYIFLRGGVGPSEIQDTPEHNRYQVMFLEPLFAGDVFDEIFPGCRIGCVRYDRQCNLRDEVGKREKIVAHLKSEISHCENIVGRYSNYQYYADGTKPPNGYYSRPEKFRASDKIAEVKASMDLVLHKSDLVTAEAALLDAQIEFDRRVAADVTESELPEVDVEFEAKGNTGYYDRMGKPVQHAGTADVELTCDGRRARIEIKPSMGDDYPAVLRQMKAANCNVLYLVKYVGVGATLDQVRKIFAASNIRVMEHYEG